MNPIQEYRQSLRRRFPLDPSEIRRIESWLATARVSLAVAILVAISVDPTELGQLCAASGLSVFYMANSIMILMLLRRRQQSTAAFRFVVHCGDIIWLALISIFAEDPLTPFFLFFFFVLAAAAYRWGLSETLGTAVAETAVLWILHFLLNGSVPLRHFTGLHVNVNEFEPQRLFLLSIFLVVMGLLLGYLGEQRKELVVLKLFSRRGGKIKSMLPSEPAKMRELLLMHMKPRKIGDDTVKEHLRDLFDKLGFGGPEDEDADEAGIAVKKPKPPNLNNGSAAASLD